jgi:hypothetical protein
MQALARLFVGRPMSILAVAALFVLAHLVWRGTAAGAGRRGGPLLLSAAAWAGYAAWESLVKARTPEADIRVDLLLIWPALAVLALWSVYRALR